MSANLAALLYLVAGVLFILSLRGLSSPATSRQGNLFGMIGMGLAVVTTLLYSPPSGIGSWKCCMPSEIISDIPSTPSSRYSWDSIRLTIAVAPQVRMA